MKRYILTMSALWCMALLCSCGKKDLPASVTTTSSTTVEQIRQVDSDTSEKKTLSPHEKVDVDLTKLSSTMVYGEVFNMLVEHEHYVGKTVRMKGQFYVIEDEWYNNGVPTFACIIQDATACCAQGLEFSLANAGSYPQDYPEPYSEITVAGNYYYYEKDGLSYLGLDNAILE